MSLLLFTLLFKLQVSLPKFWFAILALNIWIPWAGIIDLRSPADADIGLTLKMSIWTDIVDDSRHNAETYLYVPYSDDTPIL